MSVDIYAEKVSSRELSGAHLGRWARVEQTDQYGTVVAEGPVTDISFHAVPDFMAGGGCVEVFTNPTVEIAGVSYSLHDVRFKSGEQK